MSRKHKKSNGKSNGFVEQDFYDDYYDKNPSLKIKSIKYKNDNQRRAHDALRKGTLSFLGGPAGTAKSFFCVLAALEELDAGRVKKIVLTRPTVEAGQSLGYLPGDANAKIHPYLIPVLDHIDFFIGVKAREALTEEGIIEVIPIQLMRGRNLNDSFIVIDEGQNATKEQMRLCLTRIGFGSKCAITFDKDQIDLKPKTNSCINDVISFDEVSDDYSEIQFFEFTNEDIVRSDIARLVVEMYDRFKE